MCFTVTYADGGGTGTLPTQSAQAEGTQFETASGQSLSRSGFTFAGWTDGTNVFQYRDVYTVGASNIVLTALWKAIHSPLPQGVSQEQVGEPVDLTPSASFTTTLTLSADGTSATISIPAGALPGGTTVSVYPVTDESKMTSQYPSGQKFVLALIVTWVTVDGASPNSVHPLTMTISNPSIHVGDHIYALENGKLTQLGIATQNGSVTFEFSSDPVITVSHPLDVIPPSTANETSINAVAVQSSKTLAATGSNLGLSIWISVFLVAFGAVLQVAKRRKKSLIP